MIKNLFKIIIFVLAAVAAIAGISYFEKEMTPDYIEVYSDDDKDDYDF